MTVSGQFSCPPPGSFVAVSGQFLAAADTFRWMVWWRVRKRVDFPCHWWTYRKWLKTLSVDELSTPVEEIQAPLAFRLDLALSAKSSAWSSPGDHLSRAVRLVELTYPAIAAVRGDADRAALSEGWAQQRSAAVREALLELAGPAAALSSEDLAIVLTRRSQARRAVRLQAFDFTEATLAAYLDQIEVVDVSAGVPVVLIGDFGSGKSEAAEAWHRRCIRELAQNVDAPFPVWLSARDLAGTTVDDAIDGSAGRAWRQGRGASIAIDGLDETDPATAQALLEVARVVARTYTNTRLMLTARPGIVSPTAAEEVVAKLLTEESARDLVELASGRPHATWRWTADMRATVTRPFFALAAGKMLEREAVPRGEADLIRGLVENSLATGTERSAVTEGATRSVLEQLAVDLTRSGADRLTFSDRQVARSSRLVSDRADGSVTFSLPIFQHWFAAQAVLGEKVPAEEVVSDARGFNRWRWAAAVAAISAPSIETLDRLLSTWVSGNPGAAGWIIREAFAGHREWRTGDDADDLDAATSGTRLLESLRTWTDALGPFAAGVLPQPLVTGPVNLGVAVSGPRITVAFATSSPTDDRVTEIQTANTPSFPSATEWRMWTSGASPEGDAWPWTMVQSRIAKSTLAKLNRDHRLGSPEGVWAHERRYDLARRLLGRGAQFHGDLPASDVRQRAAEKFDGLGRSLDARLVFNGTTVTGSDLNDLLDWIDQGGESIITSHLPERDVEQPTGGWVWSSYTPRRLTEFEAEVYSRACEAFDEALAHSFTRLGWSMPGFLLAPFGALLEVQFDGQGRLGDIPGLTVMRVPMALMSQFTPPGTGTLWSRSGRAAAWETTEDSANAWERHSETLEAVRTWLASRDLEPIGGLDLSHTGADDMSNVRPASSVAAGWLWSDLKSLGLGSGTFPQLR